MPKASESPARAFRITVFSVSTDHVISISILDIDASEDARCAGEILMLAVGQTGLSVEQWLVRVQSADPLC
jgi:hypothetical protein